MYYKHTSKIKDNLKFYIHIYITYIKTEFFKIILQCFSFIKLEDEQLSLKEVT